MRPPRRLPLWGVLLLLLLALAACRKSAPLARSRPTTATVAITVEQDTLLARGLQSEVAAQLRQRILETQSGVPVTGDAKAELLLRVTITGVNFTQATRWEWQLVDAATGAVLSSKLEESTFGAAAGDIAEGPVAALAALDRPSAARPSLPMPPAATVPEWKAPRSATDGAKAFAVVIGVEHYREKLPAATGAEADARAFAELARTTLNVPAENVKLLLGDRATRSGIAAVLQEWLPRNTVPGGKVYVFFSGHGAPEITDGSAYLLPWDADPAYLKSGGLKVSELQAQAAALKAQHVFLFLDACFSGAGERTALSAGTRPLVPVQELLASPGVITVSAAGARESTGAHEGGGHGLFTFHLLAGLGGGADSDGNGDVSVGELQAHLVTAVRAAARRQNREQTPRVTIPEAAGGNTVLVHALAR